MFSLNKSFFIVANKVGGIVKIRNVIPSIPFRSIPGSANIIFNCVALVFLYCLFVKQTVYLKEFGGVNVTIDKHGKGHMRTEAIKEIID